MGVEGPQALGRYQLVSRIGKGGMAEIFMAKLVGALGFEKLLVIKRILPQFAADPSFVSMFVTEAKLVCQLVHPNIVQVFEFGEADGQYFIAMEHVEGIDGHRLWKSLARRRLRIPAPLGLYLVGEALKGLEHAHQAMGPDGTRLGVVHRDVSPSNLLVSWRGDVKIGDFGIALVRQESRSHAGSLKGKFGYMTPEQLAGLPVDHRSDLFSAGTVLAELLTGVRLFFGKSDFETMRNVIEVRIHALEEQAATLDPEVVGIVTRALERDPRDRYQSAGEFQEAIADYLFRHGHRLDNQALAAFIAEHVAPQLASDEQAPETPASADAEISATVPPFDGERTERHDPESIPSCEETSDLLLEGSSMDYSDEATSPGALHDTAIEPRAGDPRRPAEPPPLPELIPLHEVTLGVLPDTAALVIAPEAAPPSRRISRPEPAPAPAPEEEAAAAEEEELALEIDDRPLAERLAPAPAPAPPKPEPRPSPPPPKLAAPSFPASDQPAPAAELDETPPTSRAELQAISATRVLSRLTRAGETGLLLLRGPALAGKHREIFERVARMQAEAGSGQARRLAETRTCALHLERGVPDLVTAERTEETLAAYLLRSGVVRENQLTLALRNHREQRPVAALIAAGMLAPLQVSRQVSSFVSWSLFEAFGWSQGVVSFYRGHPCPNGAFPTGLLGPELIAKAVSYLPEALFDHYFTPFLTSSVTALQPARQQQSQFENLPMVVEVHREALAAPGVGELLARGDKREQLRRRRALYLLLECELVGLQ